MKKRFTILMAVVLLMNCLGLAQTTINWTAADQGYSNQQEITSVTFDDNVSAIFDKGTNSNNAPKYFTTGSAIRCYGGNYFTITSTDDNLTNVVLTFASGEGSNAVTTNVGTYSNGTWTGDAESVTFTIGGTSGHRRIAAFAITYGGDAPQPTYYTVTFDAGDGTFVGNTDFPNASNSVTAGTYTLPSATPVTGYTFDGWAMGETTYQAGASYTVSGNADFVASYTENTTPTPGGITATLNIQAYAEANNWVNGTKYATATVDPVTFTANGGSNTGKYYTSGQDWRFYQGESASITISVPDGYTLVSVTPTYSVSNGGVLKNGNATIASGTTVNVSGTSVTFTVGNSGSATNGQVRFTNIDVVYVSDGGTQTASDLTITNESTDLTFDLYNNTTAQVISYTTSSTGAITITPAESDYFSYVHDATAKTITITPTAVTPSAQTVTISQAADDDYYAGTATFTVSVVNSAPLANIAELTALTTAGSYNVVLTDAVVTYVSGSNAYIQDANGAVLMHKSGHGLTAGDVLNGTATVAYQLYNSNPQITDLSGVTPVSGTAPDPTEVAQSAWNYTFSNVLSQYFKITSATITQSGNKYYVSLGGESIQLYKAGSSISSLDLTKTYSITGFPTMYNTTKELQIYADPEVEASTEPSITIADATSLENLDFDAHEGSLTVTFENLTEAEIENAVAYTCDANGDGISYEWIEVNMLDGAVGYVIGNNQGEARTAYFKVCTGNYCSNIVTVNQEAYEAPTYAELPFAFNDGKAAIEGTDGLSQEGLGSDYSTDNTKLKFDGTGDWLLLQFDERPGTLTFDIKGNSFNGSTFTVQTSEDGETFTNLKNYTDDNFGNTVYSEEFTDLGENVRYIKWVYTEKVQSGGNVGLGNIALAEYVAPQEYTLTVEPFENLELITYVNDEMVMEGDGEIQVTNGNQIMLSIVAMEGYVMETLMVNGVNHVNDIANDFTYTFEMPAEDVTISATAVEDVPPTPGEWVMVNINELTEDDVFVIVGVYDEDESSFAMPNNGTGAPSAVDVTMVDNTLSGDIDDNLKWNLSIGEDGYTFYPNGETETWLYCNNTNNGVRIGDNENNVFTMTSEGYLYNNATGRYIGIYNRQDWRCYTSINNNIKDQTFAFYKRVDEGSLVTYTIDIEGYHDDNNNGGYYLIASPVSMIRPTAENGFLTEDYDLYYFDQAQENEWRNYKSKHFNIAACKGYLYASKENTTLTFTGVPYQGNGEIELSYTEGGDFPGWNLVGNPYNTDVYIDRDFYVMNPETGGEIIAGENNTIAQYQGFFVIAEEDGEILRIGDDNNGNPGSKIVLNVSNARNSVIDRALIRFGEGRTLPKFMFNPNSTKLYINQNGKDFAVVRSINENSTPVSFHAAENGNYTLSINAENVEMEYLHLIDNMTGADVDLLATPSYSFEARTTDIANRFRLVYATTTDVNGNNVEPFAFFNGSEWTINNTNNGMVQVIDQLGHVVLSENAAQRISTASMASGVYTIRLVNNNEMKTQKIIVR